MQHDSRTGEQNNGIRPVYTEHRQDSQPESAAPRFPARDATQPDRLEETQTPSREKAMAASGPGTEYWLP